MKLSKIALIMISLLFVLSIVSCSKGNNYMDGSYFATYSYMDSHGWKPQMELTIQKGKITKVDFDYVNPKNELKSMDKNYETSMSNITGTYPAKYIKELDAALIMKQSTPVDAVTGASHSSYNFNELADAILVQAAKGNMDNIILQMNDTYTASDKPDERGYVASIGVTIENNMIRHVVYDEVNDKKESKKTSEYINSELKKANGIEWKEAAKRLEQQLVEKQDPDMVDTVTGASSSSARFKALAKKAIEARNL